MTDLLNAALRLVQAYPLDTRLENITLCSELRDLTKLYWQISQGKVQAIMPPISCDLYISGTLSEWMELLYNPLHPSQGCQIQGDSHLFQILKENLQHLALHYNQSWAQKIYTRSFLYQLQKIAHSTLTPLPWASNTDLQDLRSQTRLSYQRVDRLQWILQSQGPKA